MAAVLLRCPMMRDADTLTKELPANAYTPLPPGTTSVGTRIDKRDFFTGDVYEARFTPRVLATADFLKAPSAAER